MFIYNTGILFYRILIAFAALFSKKAKLWVDGRKNLFDRLEEKFGETNETYIWVHCASLGEFEQGRPLIEKLKSLDASHKILLTFFSPSGYEIRKHYEMADFICYLPLDTAANAKRFIAICKPKMAFIIKYEFWYHHLSALKAANIPIYSVSSVFRENQLFFKSHGTFSRHILKLIDGFFVQNAASANLLTSIGIASEIVGDTRFDRVNAITQSKKDLPLIKRFKKDNKLFVIGSSWNADIEVLMPSINDFYLNKSQIGNIKIIIAPHEITHQTIKKIQEMLQRPSILYSQLENKDMSLYDVLIIDNVGMLSSIYAYANFAYIGGAFGKGLHNILEAATFGMPIFFGSNYSKFPEAIDLVTQGGAFSINSTKEFDTIFKQIASDEMYANQCKEITKSYVEANVGATEKILKYLNFI